MSRNNTGNPIDSKAFADFEDNVKNLDQAVNAEQDTFQDRLGRSRLTWAGIVKAGSGDPAIAVDAAARAVAAAEQVEQDAEQIAQEAAQQAVDNVVIAVDGAVERAEGAADRAETAADGAFVNADVYPDVASGLAAVADGEQFQVVEGEEIVRYRRDSPAVAAEVSRMLGSVGSHRISFDNNRLRQISDTQPNLLPAGQVMSTELPTETSGATSELVLFQGEPAVRVTGSSALVRCWWRISASEITSGKISAYVLIREAAVGDDGYVRINQRDASGGRVAYRDLSSAILTGAFADREFSVSGVPLHPDAEFVDIDIDFRGSGSSFVAQYPMIADGDVRGYRAPRTSFTQEDDALVQATNVERYGYNLPLNLRILQPAGGAMSVVADLTTRLRALTLSIMVDEVLSDGIGATELGRGLQDGGILRLAFTVDESTNVSVGLMFGNSLSARGFALRENGQLLTLDSPSEVTEVIGSLPSEGFAQGDRMVIDARVYAGTAGNYTVRYFAEYPDGSRIGPYDISGIESIDQAWIGVRGNGSLTDVALFRFQAPRYSDELAGHVGGSKIVHVSTDGDDSNLGTSISPFRTISKGVSSLSGGGIVEVAGGEYRETVTSNAQDSIWIRSKKGERAFILGSDQLSLTKTAGYNQVYQAPLANKPSGMGGTRGKPVIFEWGTPSKPIPADERHPLQRGKSHRLPYTEMFEAASKEMLDTPEGMGMWWWDAGVIYLSASDGSDATIKRYEARVRPCLVQSSGGLRLSRLNLMFSRNFGAQFNGDSTLTEDVVVLGSHHNGFYHQSGVWKSYRDESGGNGNDGFNGTVTGYDDPDAVNRITAFHYDPYGHDNGDDGTSYHYRGDQTVYGGLFEYNTKADVAHVTGAAVSCFDTVARGSIHGFYSTDAPSTDFSRELTTMRCVGTKAFDNQVSYRADSGSVMECSNALAVNPSVMGYNRSNDGVLVARNSKYTGDPEKMKNSGVVVINDGALT